jgi:ectoine hydroxylase-related dioxygenase (phytanoyl-CoA dioxygenase family)
MKHFESLKSNGYTVLKNFLTKEQLVEYRNELQSVIRVVGDNTSGAPIGEQSKILQDKIVNNVHYHSSKYLDLVVDGSHISIIQKFLNDPFYAIIPEDQPNFILAQCNVRKSSTAIDYHIDVRLKLPAPTGWSMQCIVALEDRHKLNGGLKVLPGSHLQNFQTREHLDLSNEKNVDLKAGDAVIFFSHLYHATNEVSETYNSAWGLLLTYRAWWAKPQFDFVNMFGEKRIKLMTNKQKTLLGYFAQPSKDWDGGASARQGY